MHLELLRSMRFLLHAPNQCYCDIERCALTKSRVAFLWKFFLNSNQLRIPSFVNTLSHEFKCFVQNCLWRLLIFRGISIVHVRALLFLLFCVGGFAASTVISHVCESDFLNCVFVHASLWVCVCVCVCVLNGVTLPPGEQYPICL